MKPDLSLTAQAFDISTDLSEAYAHLSICTMAARAATILAQTVYERSDLHAAEFALRAAKHDLDLATIRVDSLRAQLRILEVVAGKTGGGV